jgi:hypothetical protein
MIDRLQLQMGRLDINVGELEGRNQRSALFKRCFWRLGKKGLRIGARILPLL